MRGRHVLLGTIALLVSATTAHAQAFVFLGGGPTFPMGDYKDYAKTGWMAQAGVGVPVGGKGLIIGGEALFGSNKHEAPPEGDKTNLYGVNGAIAYRIGDKAKPGIFIFGTAGVLNHAYKSEQFPEDEDSEWKFAWGGGAGVQVPFGGNKSFAVQGKFMDRDGTRLIGAFVGLSFGIGGS